MESKTSRRSRSAEVIDPHTSERVSGCLLGVGALGVMFVGVLARNGFVGGMGAIMAGTLLLARLVRDYRSGSTSSNWGTWRRDESPVGFRRNIGFWAAITMLWFVLGILTILGVVHIPVSWIS